MTKTVEVAPTTEENRAETPSKSKASRILRLALNAAQKLNEKDK
jgi:hypothetical protein